MTDSVKITLDLTKLPLEARRLVPLRIATETDQEGDLFARYLKPEKLFSPMSGTKTKWIVRTENLKVEGADEWEDVATRIDADLNLPNALVGQNLEHGTSVFAAAVAGLWLIKIWLASAGVPGVSLSELGPANVTLRGVTLTYLIRCSTPAEAIGLVHDIRTTAHILKETTESYQSTNETFRLPTKKGSLGGYYKTLLKHCKYLEGAPVAEHLNANSCFVRLEPMLPGSVLKAMGLDQLEAWRAAYSQGLYGALFDKCVVEPLRLDLRHNRPRPEALNKLTPTQRALVLFYLDGGDPRQFKNVVESAFPTDTFSKMRRAILKACRLDVDIPWILHTQLRTFKFKHLLVYPGDYHPPAERAAWCFCEESWPTLLDALRECQESAIERAANESAATAAETPSDTASVAFYP